MSAELPEVDHAELDPTQAGSAAKRPLHKRPGTDDGVATHIPRFVGDDVPDDKAPGGSSETAENTGGGRPHASVLIANDSVKIVLFSFAAGDELREHAAHHPVLIEVRSGAVEFTGQDRTYRLEPGECLHLTPKLRHAVRALAPSVLTVTMLLPH